MTHQEDRAGGAVWEYWEFAGDKLLGLNSQRVPQTGVDDTMWDMITCTIGSLFVAVPGYFYLKHGHRTFFSTWLDKYIRGNPPRSKRA